MLRQLAPTYHPGPLRISKSRIIETLEGKVS
jgi:hypothetical protein